MTMYRLSPWRLSSSTLTTFGWLIWAAMRASSKNIVTNDSFSARWGRIRLMTTVRAKPSGPIFRARKSSAIPPVASAPTIA